MHLSADALRGHRQQISLELELHTVCVNKYTLAFTCLLCVNLYLDTRAIVWGDQRTICFTSIVWVLGLKLGSSGTS